MSVKNSYFEKTKIKLLKLETFFAGNNLAHLVVVREPEPDVVGHDGDKVDDAHDAPHELAPVGGGEEPEEVLRREDHDAGRVQAEEHDLVLVAAGLDLVPAGHGAARDGLDHVGHDGDGDEEARHVVEDEGGRGGVGHLEGPPHSLAQFFGLDAVAALLVVQLVIWK